MDETTKQNSDSGQKITISKPEAPAPTEPVAPYQNLEQGTYYSGNADETSPISGSPSTSGTRYLILYAISIGLLVSILSNIVTTLEVCFNYLGQSQGTDSDWLSGYTMKFLLWLVANLLITVPLYIFILLKSKNYQTQSLTSTARKFRNFLYGSFMTILGLATILSAADVIYSLIVQFAPKDDLSSSDKWWTGVIQAILTTTILGVTFFYKLKNER